MTAPPPAHPRPRRPPGPWRIAVSMLTIAGVTAGAIVLTSVGLSDPHQERSIRATRRAEPGPTPPEPEPEPAPSGPKIRAPSAILMDLRTGRILYARRPDRTRPIASLAKIMTALLVLQRSDLSDVVKVSRRASQTKPTDVGLEPGERITVRNLLYGLLLWSGNDAAVALGEHVSGTTHAFVALMNHTAHEMGLDYSRFRSPNGLNDHGYSTAREVAELTRAALKDPTLAEFVATRHHRIPGPPQQLHKLRNLNKMLFTYPGATGVKTGYTRAAGMCVVASAARGGHAFVAVVLGDPTNDHWRSAYGDATRLLDFGFETGLAAARAAV